MKRLKFQFGNPAKVSIAFFIIISFSYNTFGQAEKGDKTYGLKFNLGLAKINSSNLSKIVSEEKKYDPYLTTSNAHGGMGALEGAGGFYEYALSAKYSVMGEITLNHMNSQLYINQIRDSLDNNNSGISERISSKGKLSMFYISTKALFRYQLSEKKNYYLLAGPGLTISTHPRFNSKEQYVYNTIDQGIVSAASVTNISQKVVINKYKIAQFNFSLGIEKQGNKITYGITYSYPLSKSTLYTTDQDLYSYSIGNQKFSSRGKSEAEAASSSHHLNNFKFSSISLSVRYRLSKGKYG